MSKSVNITNAVDAASAVPAILGFRPDPGSLVVLGIGASAPTARIDVTPDTVVDALNSLIPATRHWSTVLVILHDDDPALLESLADAWAEHPAFTRINVADWLRVSSADVVYDHRSNPVGTIQGAPGILATTPVASSRDEYVAEADRVTEASEAFRLARAAYRSGNGARAWCFLDRYVDIIGSEDIVALDLRRSLERAVNPHA